MPTYDAFDVVVVPFPFTDKKASKRRPAVILSAAVGPSDMPHYVMAMITSAGNAPWPLDHRVHDLRSAGLPAPSVIRLKCFTLDQRLILRRSGSLSGKDRTAFSANIRQIFPGTFSSAQ